MYVCLISRINHLASNDGTHAETEGTESVELGLWITVGVSDMGAP